ncbi:uncharacterized protein LOC135805487 isoform X2 [Sycon ciliatum]|uniref:uncharacterized protein LOC135805487 isoform X2 n=1 Tax=Sycon ciliatum TaxID=27933 RepID=UPI0031F64952
MEPVDNLGTVTQYNYHSSWSVLCQEQHCPCSDEHIATLECCAAYAKSRSQFVAWPHLEGYKYNVDDAAKMIQDGQVPTALPPRVCHGKLIFSNIENVRLTSANDPVLAGRQSEDFSDNFVTLESLVHDDQYIYEEWIKCQCPHLRARMVAFAFAARPQPVTRLFECLRSPPCDRYSHNWFKAASRAINFMTAISSCHENDPYWVQWVCRHNLDILVYLSAFSVLAEFLAMVWHDRLLVMNYEKDIKKGFGVMEESLLIKVMKQALLLFKSLSRTSKPLPRTTDFKAAGKTGESMLYKVLLAQQSVGGSRLARLVETLFGIASDSGILYTEELRITALTLAIDGIRGLSCPLRTFMFSYSHFICSILGNQQSSHRLFLMALDLANVALGVYEQNFRSSLLALASTEKDLGAQLQDFETIVYGEQIVRHMVVMVAEYLMRLKTRPRETEHASLLHVVDFTQDMLLIFLSALGSAKIDGVILDIIVEQRLLDNMLAILSISDLPKIEEVFSAALRTVANVCQADGGMKAKLLEDGCPFSNFIHEALNAGFKDSILHWVLVVMGEVMEARPRKFAEQKHTMQRLLDLMWTTGSSKCTAVGRAAAEIVGQIFSADPVPDNLLDTVTIEKFLDILTCCTEIDVVHWTCVLLMNLSLSSYAAKRLLAFFKTRLWNYILGDAGAVKMNLENSSLLTKAALISYFGYMEVTKPLVEVKWNCDGPNMDDTQPHPLDMQGMWITNVGSERYAMRAESYPPVDALVSIVDLFVENHRRTFFVPRQEQLPTQDPEIIETELNAAKKFHKSIKACITSDKFETCIVFGFFRGLHLSAAGSVYEFPKAPPEDCPKIFGWCWLKDYPHLKWHRSSECHGVVRKEVTLGALGGRVLRAMATKLFLPNMPPTDDSARGRRNATFKSLEILLLLVRHAAVKDLMVSPVFDRMLQIIPRQTAEVRVVVARSIMVPDDEIYLSQLVVCMQIICCVLNGESACVREVDYLRDRFQTRTLAILLDDLLVSPPEKPGQSPRFPSLSPLATATAPIQVLYPRAVQSKAHGTGTSASGSGASGDSSRGGSGGGSRSPRLESKEARATKKKAATLEGLLDDREARKEQSHAVSDSEVVTRNRPRAMDASRMGHLSDPTPGAPMRLPQRRHLDPSALRNMSTSVLQQALCWGDLSDLAPSAGTAAEDDAFNDEARKDMTSSASSTQQAQAAGSSDFPGLSQRAMSGILPASSTQPIPELLAEDTEDADAQPEEMPLSESPEAGDSTPAGLPKKSGQGEDATEKPSFGVFFSEQHRGWGRPEGSVQHLQTHHGAPESRFTLLPYWQGGDDIYSKDWGTSRGRPLSEYRSSTQERKSSSQTNGATIRETFLKKTAASIVSVLSLSMYHTLPSASDCADDEDTDSRGSLDRDDDDDGDDHDDEGDAACTTQISAAGMTVIGQAALLQSRLLMSNPADAEERKPSLSNGAVLWDARHVLMQCALANFNQCPPKAIGHGNKGKFDDLWDEDAGTVDYRWFPKKFNTTAVELCNATQASIINVDKVLAANVQWTYETVVANQPLQYKHNPAGDRCFPWTYMYEVELGFCDVLQVGWIACFDKSKMFDGYKGGRTGEGVGVGDTRFSVGIDGYTKAIWINGKKVQLLEMEPWKRGDIVTCVLTLDGCFMFYVNGALAGGQEMQWNLQSEHLQIYPAVSMALNQCCAVNFGQLPFRYRPLYPALPVAYSTMLSSLIESVKEATNQAKISTGNLALPKNVFVDQPTFHEWGGYIFEEEYLKLAASVPFGQIVPHAMGSGMAYQIKNPDYYYEMMVIQHDENALQLPCASVNKNKNGKIRHTCILVSIVTSKVDEAKRKSKARIKAPPDPGQLQQVARVSCAGCKPGDVVGIVVCHDLLLTLKNGRVEGCVNVPALEGKFLHFRPTLYRFQNRPFPSTWLLSEELKSALQEKMFYHARSLFKATAPGSLEW